MQEVLTDRVQKYLTLQPFISLKIDLINPLLTPGEGSRYTLNIYWVIGSGRMFCKVPHQIYRPSLQKNYSILKAAFLKGVALFCSAHTIGIYKLI